LCRAGNPEKKEGSKACCPRKFQKLRLTFLKIDAIDARDVAYKAKAELGWLAGWLAGVRTRQININVVETVQV
jgi:hypothetical protein